MRKIEFTIPGEPVAQGRPRFTTRGGFPRAYDPEKSHNYKEHVRISAMLQLGNLTPLQGPLALGILVYRSMPKSFSKAKQTRAEGGVIVPTTKPDMDNYVKGIKDALKGICWVDDSQVTDYIEPFGKRYSANPRVEITVIELDKEGSK